MTKLIRPSCKALLDSGERKYAKAISKSQYEPPVTGTRKVRPLVEGKHIPMYDTRPKRMKSKKH